MWPFPEAWLETAQEWTEDRRGSCSRQIKVVDIINSKIHWCQSGDMTTLATWRLWRHGDFGNMATLATSRLWRHGNFGDMATLAIMDFGELVPKSSSKEVNLCKNKQERFLIGNKKINYLGWTSSQLEFLFVNIQLSKPLFQFRIFFINICRNFRLHGSLNLVIKHQKNQQQSDRPLKLLCTLRMLNGLSHIETCLYV